MAQKQKKSKGEIAVKIIAAILAVLMVLGFGATLIFYLVSML